MKGLYDRDYNNIKFDEIKEKTGIEKLNNSGAKFGQKIYFRSYPKEIRHSLSLFPNNYMDIVELKDIQTLEKQCQDFESLLNDTNNTELNIKRFIQDNKYYHIPASIFKRYSFAHHEAVLFKEFQLGTSYKADYLLAGKGSGGWQFIYVEFENVYKSVILQDGNLGDTVRKGINQINDWKSYIEANYSSIKTEFEKYTNKDLPKEFTSFDSSRMHYVVVSGRRKDYDISEKARLRQRKTEQEQNIKILHYDNLLDDARALIGMETY